MAADRSDVEPVRSPYVWYDDGTLVIRAENTLFRVSRGILASQSDVFKDMVSVPQPPSNDAETFEGCAVVYVHDTAEDMERFLRTILDIRYFSQFCSLNVSHFASTMRLASKYAADGVLRRGVEHLENIFPVSISIHDYDAALSRRFCLSPDEVVALANLVQELHFSKLVASLAFTCALDMSPETVMDGVVVGERQVELSPRMKRNALKVRTNVVQLLNSLLCRWMIDAHNSCVTKAECPYYFRMITGIFFSSTWSTRVNLPPYTADERLSEPSKSLYQGDVNHWLPIARPGYILWLTEMCRLCLPAFREEYTGLRDQIWQSVPSWIGDCEDWTSGDDV